MWKFSPQKTNTLKHTHTVLSLLPVVVAHKRIRSRKEMMSPEALPPLLCTTPPHVHHPSPPSHLIVWCCGKGNQLNQKHPELRFAQNTDQNNSLCKYWKTNEGRIWVLNERPEEKQTSKVWWLPPECDLLGHTLLWVSISHLFLLFEQLRLALKSCIRMCVPMGVCFACVRVAPSTLLLPAVMNWSNLWPTHQSGWCWVTPAGISASWID